ncbi:hypothetical protein BJ138DRAFT_1154312 [Hygrophoropsis aurantiaca]|uniref:Uncharacterized protein n=1 Tax=Hygrophoropsis aurantiaca TaxID=72124 RepID=A0ACB8AAZ6_9AGAM|nr:hypothetical protein BJ138DRAFT_1154312 [Hygrophoropsis aurantiaca]
MATLRRLISSSASAHLVHHSLQTQQQSRLAWCLHSRISGLRYSSTKPQSFKHSSLSRHYETLGLPREATQREIEIRTVELYKAYHPDEAVDGKGSMTGLKKVKDAFYVLGNAKRRKEYDQNLALYLSLQRGRTKEEQEGIWEKREAGGFTFYRPPRGYFSMMNKIQDGRVVLPKISNHEKDWTPDAIPERSLSEVLRIFFLSLFGFMAIFTGALVLKDWLSKRLVRRRRTPQRSKDPWADRGAGPEVAST